jgi:outer membrane protein TolC
MRGRGSRAPVHAARVASVSCVARVLVAACLALVLPAAAFAQARIEVGRVSDLDLAELRRMIDTNAPVVTPAVTEQRSLTLEDSLAIALDSNLRLQIVRLDVQTSEYEVSAAKSKFHPSLGATVDAEGTRRARDPEPDDNTDNQEVQIFIAQEVPTGGQVKLGLGYGRNFREEFNTGVGIDGSGQGTLLNTAQIGGLGIEIRQPLLRGGRIFVARRQILDAKYDNEIERAQLNAEILRVTAQTKAAYYEVVRAARQIEVIEQAIERGDALSDASQALFDAGRVSKVDVYSARIGQSNDRRRLASARADLEVAKNGLLRVLGLAVDTELEILDRTIPFEPVALSLKEWIARAMRDRPELVRFRSQLDKAELAVRVSKNASLPTLDVRGGFQPGFDWQSYNWTAGLGFDYKIGNVAGRSRVSQANIEHDRVRREYMRARRDIDLEVREIEIRLRENVERVRNLTLQVENSRSKGEIARGRFEMGLANNLDITNADEQLIRAETLLLEALVAYATNVAELEARIAGPL